MSRDINYIIREMRENEKDKIERILKGIGFDTVNFQRFVYVLTIPNGREPDGKRWIVGVIMWNGLRISYLGIDKNHRRKGYAKELIRHVMENHRVKIHLRVRIFNYRAILLYLKMGFRIIGLFNGRSIEMSHDNKSNIDHESDNEVETYELEPKPLTLLTILKEPARLTLKEGKLVMKNTTHNLLDLMKIGTKFEGKLDESIIPERVVERITMAVLDRNISTQVVNKLKTDLENWSKFTTTRGSWLKRFQAFVYNEHRIKLESSYVAEYINSTLKQYRPINYSFEFVDKVDWKAGDFGDKGSCWFDAYKFMKDALFNSGHGYAIKFYENKKKFGRAWVSLENNRMYVFNVRGYSTNEAGRILSHALGLKFVDAEGYVHAPFGCGIEQPIILGKSVKVPARTYNMKWAKS